MKIAIVHLSDFHIKENDKFAFQKVEKLISALNVCGKVDEYIVVFSGDFAYSGKINEYKKARELMSKIIRELKTKNNNNFVKIFMVPGNHDLCMDGISRESTTIQEFYKSNTIDEHVDEEIKGLNNYCDYSTVKKIKLKNNFVKKEYYKNNRYKIQFNLINTTPFSTLKPDDKELHYFPDNELFLLNRDSDSNLVITIMHHSCEWFHWKCRTTLENAIVDNSEFIFHGHDHREHTNSISIDNGINTIVSSAGEMKFTTLSEVDSFNVLILETEKSLCNGFIFTWNCKVQMYEHKCTINDQNFQNHTTKLIPIPSFIKNLKRDGYNLADDFNEYFVFPKLIAESQKDYVEKETISNYDELIDYLEKNKVLFISGDTNSGKTTLLKHIYCEISKTKLPILFSADSKRKININNFVKHLFEEQYGEDHLSYEKFLQIDSNKKVLIIDGWEYLKISSNSKDFIQNMKNTFDYIIISSNNISQDIVNLVKDDLTENIEIKELRIKPFFADKRSELVEKVCKSKKIQDNIKINNVNKLIDSLVSNNKSLFSLNPAFIVQYTNYFIDDNQQDYTMGEKVFSRIFEYELNRAILKFVDKEDIDEIFSVFEELAGYIYETQNDILKTGDIELVINKYNNEYGEKIKIKNFVEVAKNAKIMNETENLTYYFINKNHLAYFIAKYLIKELQDIDYTGKGIDYAIKNICFGINADIVMFISYLLNNTNILAIIYKYSEELFKDISEISLDKKNILLFNNVDEDEMNGISEKGKQEYKMQKEKIEERNYSESSIEGVGLFDYDVKEINNTLNRFIRANKYTEILCKALPVFYSKIKLDVKKNLVDIIYSNVRKISYALIGPIDSELNSICDDLLKFAHFQNKKKKNGDDFTKDDILKMLNIVCRATMLIIFDHFSEIATSNKTIELLENKTTTDLSEKLFRLLVIENSGNTELLIKEAKKLYNVYEKTNYKKMIQLIIRKHIFTNKNLTRNLEQKMIDIFFGPQYRKNFLLNNK